MTFIPSAPTPIEIVSLSAVADKRLRKGLDTHLSAMKREGLISAWHQSDIRAGASRADEISRHLKAARIVVLLISPDLFASDEDYTFATEDVFQRHEAGEIRLIPVLLRPVDWQGTPFQKLASLPSNGLPVTLWPNRDEALRDVALGIRKAVEELTASVAPSLLQAADEASAACMQSVLLPAHIPDERYYPLPGRERSLEQLLSGLHDPQGPLAIIIDGLGGLGKTALAVELVRRALRLGEYEKVIGESAQQELFTGGEIIQVREAVLDFESLLDALVRQLGLWGLLSLKAEEKYTFLVQHMRQHRLLLLVDNLEAVANAHALVARLRDFLGRSRAIITSRHKVRHDFVRMLSLQGLDLDDSLFFLRKDIEQRDIQPLRDIPREKLIEIHQITGGAPLAMKLVVAQARFLALDAVLNRLRQAGGDLYAFLFYQSWRNLSPAAQRALIYIGRTVVTTVSWQELASVAIAGDEQALMDAIEQLVAYSLLDVTSTEGQARYGIHQLTRQFVNGDLPDIWRRQGLL